MNKTLLIRQTEVNAERYAKELYEADITVSINKETLKVTVKPKNKGSVRKEIKEFIINYCNEELAPLKTKSVDDSVVIADDAVVMATNNNNNDIATAIGQAVKDAIEVTKPDNKTWDDITLEEVNRGHMLQYKDTPIPVMQIDGKGMEHYKVSFVGMKSKVQYYWNCYGDVLYMTLSDVMEMFDLKKNKYKSVIKPLDDKVQKIYGLTKYYELIDEATNLDMVELFDKPIEEIREFVNNIKKTLENDVFLNLRNRICLYLITAKGRYTIDELNEILEIFDLTPYDIHLESIETRKFI